jgi:hypothetical protein
MRALGGAGGGRGSAGGGHAVAGSTLALPGLAPSLSSLAPLTAVAGTSAYDDAVREFIDVLEVHMANCEKLSRYAEADIARYV